MEFLKLKIIKELISKLKKIEPSILKKDILEILKGRKTGDYTAVFKTKAYNKQSGAYCNLLSNLEFLIRNSIALKKIFLFEN